MFIMRSYFISVSMKVGKYFSWDMAHRLIHHNGKCYNIHGHTYKTYIEIEGEVNKEGMVMEIVFHHPLNFQKYLKAVLHLS